MQLAVEFELPDELGEQLLQHANLQTFVQQAIEKMLLEEKLEAKKEQANNPLFGIWQDNVEISNVDAYIRHLRKGRFHVG